MIKWIKYSLLLLVLFVGLAPAKAQKDCFPKKRDNVFVYDEAEILSDVQEGLLNSKLIAFKDSTSNVIVVVTTKSLCENDRSTYTIQLGDKLGVGRDDLDNGIVLMVKPKEIDGRGDTFIATGEGLEGAIPDAVCGQIRNNELIPNFKNKNYYRGIDAGTTVLMELAAGDYSYDNYMAGRKKSSLLKMIGPLFFMLIFALMNFRRVRRYAIANDLTFWMALSMMNQSGRSHGGHFDNFGSGGGGFGGFGGGGFGGGGAGGSW